MRHFPRPVLTFYPDFFCKRIPPDFSLNIPYQTSFCVSLCYHRVLSKFLTRQYRVRHTIPYLYILNQGRESPTLPALPSIHLVVLHRGSLLRDFVSSRPRFLRSALCKSSLPTSFEGPFPTSIDSSNLKSQSTYFINKNSKGLRVHPTSQSRKELVPWTESHRRFGPGTGYLCQVR